MYVFYDFKNKEELSESDPEFNYDLDTRTLGDVVKKPINDTLSIGKIQTDYILYHKGEITFEQHIGGVMENLKQVLNYPFNPQPNYLFSVGYDETSAVQFYFLGNKEETRTVIFRVEAGKKENKVSVIYDGNFYKLVSISRDDNNALEAYDKDDNMTLIEVE